MTKQELKDEKDKLIEGYIFLKTKSQILACDVRIMHINTLIKELDHGSDRNAEANK